MIQNMEGWTIGSLASGVRHVLPINDLKPHTLEGGCWCQPREIDPDLWVHNSLDEREKYERGEKVAA